MRPRRARGWLVGSLVCVAGCSGLVAPDAALLDAPLLDGAVAPSVELGTGLESFEAFSASGPELELVHGPQGGYHVHLSMRVRGLEPMSLHWQVFRVEDGRSLANLPLDARPGRFVPVGDALERVGELVILDITGPADLVGREVRVDASVRAASGEVASSTITARVVDLEP